MLLITANIVESLQCWFGACLLLLIQFWALSQLGFLIGPSLAYLYWMSIQAVHPLFSSRQSSWQPTYCLKSCTNVNTYYTKQNSYLLTSSTSLTKLISVYCTLCTCTNNTLIKSCQFVHEWHVAILCRLLCSNTSDSQFSSREG